MTGSQSEPRKHRPLAVVLFLLDMDYLLYEMSVQRGDAHISLTQGSA